MQSLEHWAEWKEKCALGLCEAETQTLLQGFAYARFRKFVDVHTSFRERTATALAPTATEAWHCFETHLQITTSREGKSYKNWLFARAAVEGDATLDSVQGGATLVMRDVVREQIRRESSLLGMTALDAPVGQSADEAAPTLHELLPGPSGTADDVERRELEKIAATHAKKAFASLNHRERVALLARETGLSLAHPEVLAAAHCRKSVLNSAYYAALQTVAEYVRSSFRQEDRSTQAILTVMIFDYVKILLLEWKDSEKQCSRFSLLMDEDR